MIHQSLIDSAKEIRKEWQKTRLELDEYQKQVAQLAEDFENGASKVESIRQDIKKKKSVELIKSGLMSVLVDIEEKYNHLFEQMKQMNSRMDFLKQQEKQLYDLIKKRYPSLSDDDIKNEIHSRI